MRSDFWELLEYATAHHVGVKFSTNGVKITPEIARYLAANDYVDVQVSIDGATAEVNDNIRGPGSYETALRAVKNLSEAGMKNTKVSVVCTRQNIGQLDEFKRITDEYGAQLRLTRLRPSGRATDVWDELHPTQEQQRELYNWLVDHADEVLTGDSFFHLSAYGDALPGLNLCGAGRVVCLIDPIGDVYACPFAIHEEFLAGTVREPGGFEEVWRHSELFTRLREPQSGGACASCQFFDTCKGGCMAAKFFTGLPLDGPDPECVVGYGEQALAERKGDKPKHLGDHSHRTSPPRPRTGMGPVRVTLQRREEISAPPVSACNESPLAGFDPERLKPERQDEMRPQGGTRPDRA